MAARLQWDCEYILQGCDKLVKEWTMWLQGCSGIVNILQGCVKVVARL